MASAEPLNADVHIQMLIIKVKKVEHNLAKDKFSLYPYSHQKPRLFGI